MTEAEWLACTNYDPMLKLMRPRATSRKLRLFAVACCRFIWDFMPNEDCRHSVLVAERYADGLATASELASAEDTARQFDTLAMLISGQFPYEARTAAAACFYQSNRDDLSDAALGAAWSAGNDSARAASRRGPPSGAQITVAERFREIFGNPFRPVALDRSWLTSTVVALAEGIYQERAFDRMPILADALQDAGCDNDDILNHCRQPGEHVRGCWVVDLLTGRK